MRERAQLIGAKLSISGRPGKGTAVVVTVPALARGRE
jgi:signal transduction histidine kinase